MTNKHFEQLFQKSSRNPEDILEQFHMDIAASIQTVIEDVILKITDHLFKECQISNLCLAGGVALNCVSNSKIVKQGKFKNLWIQPAAGDAGGAIGAAFAVYHLYHKRSKKKHNLDLMQGAYLGPHFLQKDVEQKLFNIGAKFCTYEEEKILEKTVSALVEGKAIGWMEGRMEFGPRSLGRRSILADPRSPLMQKILNLKIKYRESFRPFAPSILAEDATEWFDLTDKSPYMLLVANVREKYQTKIMDHQKNLFGLENLNIIRSVIPAVTHVDYSARIQTVHQETNPRYHALLTKFKEATGCPILVNTSFNVRGEPIVCSPEDAFRCFMGTQLDVLVIENTYLIKEEQDQSLKLDYKNAFSLD